MLNSLRLLIVCLGVWFTVKPACSTELAGPVEIIDGDTIVIGEVTVRLHGIDAAETGQRCVGEGRKIVRPGDAAVELLEKLASGGLACSGTEHDDYGRLIAVCHTPDGFDVDRALVEAGWAWAFVRYSSDYVDAEETARAKKLGVWAMACEPPWEFRRKRWDVAIQKAPAGCPIKGNISNNGRIYHTPWSRHYARTKIDTSKGERWFCSEKEAVEAGWRPPRR